MGIADMENRLQNLGDWSLPGARAIVAACGLLGFAVLLIGCGKDSGVVRLPVGGKVVRADGKPLSGSITFLPAEGRPGPAATTRLVDGKYQFDRSNGPTAGPSRVIVKQVIPKGKMLAERNSAPPNPAQSSAPAGGGKMDWILSVNVSTDGPFQCDFKLDQ